MSRELTMFQLQQCDIQGRLFELAKKEQLDCPSFIEAFMKSHAASCLDDTYDRLQWAGEEYILEELEEEVKGLKKEGITYDNEVMYWTGYVYRYWHYYTGAMSKDIYDIAPAERMKDCYFAFHTFDVELAIENLIEIYQQTKKAK